MTFSMWDRVAAVIAPPLILLLDLTAPLRERERPMMYQPPQTLSDRDELRMCRDCDAETMHTLIFWVSGEVTADCRCCGVVTEVEARPE